MSAKAVIRMPGEAEGVTLSGEPLAFLVTGEHTKHTSMFEWTMPARFSTGLHVHRVQEETFYMLEGECEWQISDQRVRATPGTYVFIPPGVPHNTVANAVATSPPPGYHDRLAARPRALLRGARQAGRER